MIDDTSCDCTKFVLKALLESSSVRYDTGTFFGVTVPAFGGTKLENLTGVDGMLKEINSLVSSHRAAPIKANDPRSGDIMFWTDHNAIVIDVIIRDGKLLLSVVGMGTAKGNPMVHEQIPLKKVEGNLMPYHFGDGDWLGFWTPL